MHHDVYGRDCYDTDDMSDTISRNAESAESIRGRILHMIREEDKDGIIDLDILSGPFTDKQIMLLSHKTDNSLIKIISGSFDRSTDNSSSQ